MLAQFLLQNLHFALSIFVAMVLLWTFWLYLDVWQIKKTVREFLKFTGFFLLALSFIFYGIRIETIAIGSEFISRDILNTTVLISRFFGYLLICLGVIVEPVLPNPNNPSHKKSKTLAGSLVMFSFLGLSIPIEIFNFTLPALSVLCGVLYLYKATYGLEFHLRRVSASFFVLSVFELFSLGSLFTEVTKITVFKLVAPFGPIWMAEHLLLLFGALILGVWVFSYLLRRLQTQLFIFFSLTILLIFVISTVSFTFLLLDNLQNQAKGELKTNVLVLEYSINSKKEALLSDIEVFSGDESLVTLLDETQKTKLSVQTSDFLVQKSLSFLVVTDPNGKVLARGEDPERTSEALSGNSQVKRSLLGEKVSGALTRDGALSPEVLISASVPVKDGGDIVGAVYGGILIDNSLVDGIHKSTGLASSVYGQNKISATSILTSDGEGRQVGIVESNSEITEKVLGKGEPYTGSVNFLNIPYFVSYLPIMDGDNVPIGMLSVGKPEIGVLETAGRSIQGSFVVAGILWFLSILPSYLISRYIEKQLR